MGQSNMNETTINSQKMLETVRNYFTQSEWLAIEEAIEDYQDYGENAVKLVSQIEYKIYKLFNTNMRGKIV